MQNRNKSNKINRLRRIREWEKSNLPTYGTDAGYALLIELASSEENSALTLKGLYLSIPHAESTIRLLLRNLEEDGWLELPKDRTDQRFRSFIPTEKFNKKIDEWLDQFDNMPNI